MSVLIKGMDMPKYCWSCPMIQVMVGKKYCGRTLSDIKNSDIKLPDCHLVEVPTPHGRLIDETPMLRALEYTVKDNPDPIITIGTIIRDIKNRPTIIEAEE